MQQKRTVCARRFLCRLTALFFCFAALHIGTFAQNASAPAMLAQERSETLFAFGAQESEHSTGAAANADKRDVSPTENESAKKQASSSHEEGLDWILFVILALAVGTAARHWGAKIPGARLFPYTVLLMILGFGFGIADRFGWFAGSLSAFDNALNWAANIQPSLILFIFLPTLIFEAAFAIDFHTFKKSVVNALILAVPGMIIATLMTAFAMLFTLDLPGWSLYIAILFGAMVSANDPVAVVALLKELGASKKLSTLIDGESLLNDGVAIVIFTVFLEYVRLGVGIEALNLAALLQSFLKTVVVGTCIGLIVAGATIAWVRRVFNDALVEITVMVIAAYLTFYIAEHFLHVSGILGLVALGLVMSGVGRTRISPQVEHFLHEFWEMAAYLANTLIFIIVGVLIAERTVFSTQDVINLLALYLIIHVVRAVMIAVCYPFLRRFGYGIAPKDTVILWWGALRGALGLCLCLIVLQEPSIPKPIQQQIMFYMAGIVFLTLTVNATTIKWVIDRLGLINTPIARQAMNGNALQELSKSLQNVLLDYKYRHVASGVRWSAVRAYLPEQRIKRQEVLECSDEETLAEIRLRLLETERAFYQHQFHEGLLGADAVRTLSAGISVATDDGGKIPLSERPYLDALWSTPAYIERFAALPLVGGIIARARAKRLAFIYDTAKGFIEAQEHLKTLVHKAELYDINQNDDFDENEMQMARTLLKEISDVERKADNMIRQLRAEHPQVALAAETVDAIRAALNTELAVIDSLHNDGMLKQEDAKKLAERVEAQIKAIANYPPMLDLPDAQETVRELPWLAEASPLAAEAFAALVEERSFSKGEALTHGAASYVFIIVHGDARARKKGVVKSIGGVIGAFEALCSTPPADEFVAETNLRALTLPAATLREFTQRFPECEEAIWRWTSAELVEEILQRNGFAASGEGEEGATTDWLLNGIVRKIPDGETVRANEALCVLIAGEALDRDRVIAAPAFIAAEEVKAKGESFFFFYRRETEQESVIEIVGEREG